MSILRDIAYVRFGAPDTDEALRFLSDFGLSVATKDNGRTYLRCAGPQHHIYILEEGPADFLGVGFEADSEEALHEIASHDGVDVRPSPEPGGGLVVTLTDIDGYRVDVVHGVDRVDPLDSRPPLVINFVDEKPRVDATQRPEIAPAEIRRLGHIGIKVSSLPDSVAWYSQRLGLKTSDILTAGPEAHEVAAFLRLDRGEEPVDHHSLVLFESQNPQFHHCAFETEDYDAVATSHHWMRDHDWDHSFGVGRHLLGSQIFDYWLDPWDRKHEHFADGDVFTDARQTERHSVEVAPIAIWGPEPPPNFVE